VKKLIIDHSTIDEFMKIDFKLFKNKNSNQWYNLNCSFGAKSEFDSSKNIDWGYGVEIIDWIDALEKRSLTAHIYNEDISMEAENLIRKKYISVLRQLYNQLKNEA